MTGEPSEAERWSGLSPEERQDAYDAEELETYDRIEWLCHLWTGRYRRKMFADVEGRLADIACGPGATLRYLPESAEVVAVDISPDVLRWARQDVAVGAAAGYAQHRRLCGSGRAALYTGVDVTSPMKLDRT